MIKKYIIKGEDPNCDLGGYHHNPIIGYAEGEYEDVLAYAKTLKKWNTWGSGGELVEFIMPDFKFVDKNTAEVEQQRNRELKEKQDSLRKQKENLEKQLHDIEKQLNS